MILGGIEAVAGWILLFSGQRTPASSRFYVPIYKRIDGQLVSIKYQRNLKFISIKIPTIFHVQAK